MTTPQEISTIVCSRAINAAKELKAPIIGLIENMNSYTCPDCGRQEYFFGKERGKKLAKTFKIPYLGGIPLDGQYSDAADSGVPIVLQVPGVHDRQGHDADRRRNHETSSPQGEGRDQGPPLGGGKRSQIAI